MQSVHSIRDIMESSKHVLKLSYGERNACISVTTDISFSTLREKAAKKFSLSQSFTLECYEVKRFSSPCWLEVDEEDMERLSEWRELRVRALDDRGHVINYMQSGSNSHSNVTEATGVEVSKPIQSAVDPAGDGCGHTEEDSVSGNGQVPAAGDGCGQIAEEPVSSDVQTLDDDDEESETECEPVRYCTEPMLPEPDDSDSVCDGEETIERLQATSGAYVQKTKLWRGRDMLFVYLRNPDYLQKGKYPLTVSIILAWAGSWNNALVPDIPKFGRTDSIEKADIRIQFGDGLCWSKVGTDAKLVDRATPTMFLSLKDVTPDFQQYLVMHEFGHALGLLHEHQRSDFWKEMLSLLDVEKMKKDPRMRGVNFNADILELDVPDGETTEYDADSVMHYWFDVKWLKNKKHKKLANVLSDKKLSPTQVKFLEGVHKRHLSIASDPSRGDLCFLQQCYGPGQPPPPVPAASIATAAAATESTVTVQHGPAHTEAEVDYNKEVDAIASEMGLNPTHLDRRFADKHLLRVAKKLANWKAYTSFLHLSELEVANIEQKFVNSLPHEKPQAMLKRWVELCYVSNKGHYRYLLRVILEVEENRQLVGDICRILLK